MKLCTSCGLEKSYEELNKCASKRDGLSNKCKDCNKAYLKRHYDSDPNYYRRKNGKRRDWIKEYILGKKVLCSNCHRKLHWKED